MIVRLSIAVLCLTATCAAWQAGGAAPEGIYTAAQAERGRAVFERRCITCHNVDLKGNAGRGPALVGDRFKASWEAKLPTLFGRMTQAMPRNSPGSLTPASYRDVFAYVLEANGFPVAPAELDAAAFERAMERAGGHVAVANFALVSIVGCLVQSDSVWELTHTSDAVVAPDRPASADELRAAAARALGAGTYRLVSVAGFGPNTYRGGKVQVKGLIYRAPPEPNRLNVTSIEPLERECPQ